MDAVRYRIPELVEPREGRGVSAQEGVQVATLSREPLDHVDGDLQVVRIRRAVAVVAANREVRVVDAGLRLGRKIERPPGQLRRLAGLWPADAQGLQVAIAPEQGSARQVRGDVDRVVRSIEEKAVVANTGQGIHGAGGQQRRAKADRSARHALAAVQLGHRGIHAQEAEVFLQLASGQSFRRRASRVENNAARHRTPVNGTHGNSSLRRAARPDGGSVNLATAFEVVQGVFESPSCCACTVAATSRLPCASTATPPHRRRSPRRCAPLCTRPRCRCPEPPCVNGYASTIPVSAMPCSNCNNKTSPSATATAGACRTERPPCQRQASSPRAVPPFRTRDALGTERRQPSEPPTPCAHSPTRLPQVGNPCRPAIATVPRQFPLTRSRDSHLPDRGR